MYKLPEKPLSERELRKSLHKKAKQIRKATPLILKAMDDAERKAAKTSTPDIRRCFTQAAG